MWQLILGVASAQVTVESTGVVYPTIGDGIANAAAGDTLRIAGGTYLEQLVVDRDLSLLWEGGVTVVVRSDDPCTAVISVGVGVDLTLEGLRIESQTCRGIDLPGGNALTATAVELATMSDAEGGGIRAVDPVSVGLFGVLFDATEAATDGGGLYVDASAGLPPVTLADVLFFESQAGVNGIGGGVRLRGVDFSCLRCTFASNVADVGGGLFDLGGSSLSITDSAFDGCTATSAAGGLGFDQSLDVSVIRTRFCGNSTPGEGGGIAGASLGSVDVANSEFDSNTATVAGAAIYAYAGAWSVRNDAVVGNASDLGFIDAAGTATLDIRNGVFVDNLAFGVWVSTGSASVNYAIFHGNRGDYFFIDTPWILSVVDPGFVAWSDDGDCTNDDLWPTRVSALADAGDPAILDLDGSRSDIGVTGGPDSAPEPWVDADLDGVPFVFECDDTNPDSYFGAPEVCDDDDNDCDGTIDEEPSDVPPLYADCDGDGQGSWATEILLCDPPAAPACPGGVWRSWDDLGDESRGDCDDADPTVFLDAPELCAPGDQDCRGDGDLDAVDAPTWYTDADGDAFGDAPVVACLPPPGVAVVDGDCDEGAATTHPGAPDACGDDVDQDCSGYDGVDAELQAWVPHSDGDGFGAAGGPVELDCADRTGTGWIVQPYEIELDCADGDATVSPAAIEVCNGVDDDCSGTVDDLEVPIETWYADLDGDSFGGGAGVQAWCSPGPDHVLVGGDCDDADDVVNPGGVDVCNGVDDDCSGLADDVGPVVTWYPDADGDGFGGDAGAIESACEPSGAWLDVGGDCDDASAGVHPDAVEACNGADDDCDGAVDADDDGAVGLVDGWPDADDDGFGGCRDRSCSAERVCVSDLGAGWDDSHSDCDDADPAVSPAAEEVPGNDVDEDCDGDAVQGDDKSKGCGCAHADPRGALVFGLAMVALRRRSRR